MDDRREFKIVKGRAQIFYLRLLDQNDKEEVDLTDFTPFLLHFRKSPDDTEDVLTKESSGATADGIVFSFTANEIADLLPGRYIVEGETSPQDGDLIYATERFLINIQEPFDN